MKSVEQVVELFEHFELIDEIKKKKNEKNSKKMVAETPVKLGRALDNREKFYYTRAQELSAIGLTGEARKEVKRLEKSIRKNLTGVLWLSNIYHKAGGYSESLKLLQLYKDFATKSGERTLSPRFWKYFFPLAYREAVTSNSKYRKVDPFFVNGLLHDSVKY